MAIQNTTLVPAVIEVINQVSGSYSAPFWDGLLAVTESLDTVRAVKGATELKNFPLYCPKCRQESLIHVKNFHIIVITEPDA